MSDLNLIYRDQIMRAVLGQRPVVLAREADTTALDRFVQRLVDAEEAIALLCANGCGIPAQSLPELVCAALGIEP